MRFPISGIRSAEIVVADLGAACDFYTSVWGLEIAARGNGAAWLRGSGSDAYLLAIRAGERSAIASFTLRTAAEADLFKLAAAALAHDATLLHGPQAADEPGGGTLLAFRDPRGRTIRLVQDDALAAPLDWSPDRPDRLAHVNVNSTGTDADCAFFVDALGFHLTDRSKMMGFVRTNADHHSIVIADAAVNTLNHIAFNLPDWEGVMRASGRMRDAGHPIGWGPGRHGPGNNVFAYFVDPFGFVVEYTAEVLQVDEHYRVGGPADWRWAPGRTDQWGIAPHKSPECKAAQLAIPFA